MDDKLVLSYQPYISVADGNAKRKASLKTKNDPEPPKRTVSLATSPIKEKKGEQTTRTDRENSPMRLNPPENVYYGNGLEQLLPALQAAVNKLCTVVDALDQVL